MRRNVANARSTIRTTAITSGRIAGAIRRLPRSLIPRSSATTVSTQTGTTSRPSTKLTVPATPRMACVTTAARLSTKLLATAWKFATVLVATPSAMLRTGSGRSPIWACRSRRKARIWSGGRQSRGDLDDAVQQRGNDQQHDADEHPQRDQLGDQGRHEPRHEAVEAIRDRQHRVGEDHADHERQDRRPGSDDQAHDQHDRQDREEAPPHRFRGHGPEAVGEGGPARAGSGLGAGVAGGQDGEARTLDRHGRLPFSRIGERRECSGGRGPARHPGSWRPPSIEPPPGPQRGTAAVGWAQHGSRGVYKRTDAGPLKSPSARPGVSGG